MNRFDKKLYNALNYFANNRLKVIMDTKENDIHKFRENVSKDIEEYAFDEKYLDADERRKYGITPAGLEQLRILEGIKHNQKTYWVSIIAIIISLITFIINIYLNFGGN
ncbi:TPA: hypothetical protein ENS27_02145 [bacterium]|nr:hypothetical protein [bacterium]